MSPFSGGSSTSRVGEFRDGGSLRQSDLSGVILALEAAKLYMESVPPAPPKDNKPEKKWTFAGGVSVAIWVHAGVDAEEAMAAGDAPPEPANARSAGDIPF